MTSREVRPALRRPAARAGDRPSTQREMDLAASIQQVTEEIMLRAARHVHARTGMKNLCLAGGVALNCVGNGRILREGPFEQHLDPAGRRRRRRRARRGAVHLAPAPGQAAHAASPRDSQQGSLLGPAFSATTRSRRSSTGWAPCYRRFDDEDACARHVGRAASPTRRSSAGCRGGWSSARGPSAAAASSATPAARRCSR